VGKRKMTRTSRNSCNELGGGAEFQAIRTDEAEEAEKAADSFDAKTQLGRLADRISAFRKETDCAHVSSGAHTCLQAALNGSSGLLGCCLGDEAADILDFMGSRVRTRDPPPFHHLHNDDEWTKLWSVPYFRCLFAPGVGAHLGIAGARTSLIRIGKDTREFPAMTFPIEGGDPMQTPPGKGEKNEGTLADFEGNRIWPNFRWDPQEFVHGIQYSALLSLLIDGAKLKRSRRTKKHFKGAWVAKKDDFQTCDQYAAPELALCDAKGPLLVQTFVLGRTLDLRTPVGDKWYRCITSPEGHECTHVVVRVWNASEGRRHDPVQMTKATFQDSLSGYHFRPPGGLNDEQWHSFATSFKESLASAVCDRNR
jgi:hypothetical protein